MLGKDRAPESELIRQAKEGDEDAFGALLQRHADALQVVIRRWLTRPMLRKVSVADVRQQVHLVALRCLAGFEDRGEGSFRGWLERIAEFEARAVARRFGAAAKRDVAREVTRGKRRDTANFVGAAPTPSQVAIAKELEAAVPAAMEKLSPDHREVLRLLQEEQVTFEEAAKRLDRSVAAARKLYGRALARLGELLNVRGKEGR